jgi:hypothetical protein
MNTTMKQQILDIMNQGYSEDEILVNCGSAAWGDDGPCLATDAESIRASWIADGQNCSDLPVLPTAREWLANH